METLKVKTPKSTQNLSFSVKRADPETTAKEIIVIGAIGNNAALKAQGVYKDYGICTPTDNANGLFQTNLKAINGFQLKQLKIAGTGAKTLFTTGVLDFIHVDNTQKQNKVSLSTFADEYKYLDTLLTIPVEYSFNQNNGLVIDISGLDKDETIKIDIICEDFADYHAE